MLGCSRVCTFLAGINGSQCYEIMYLDLLNVFVMFSFRSCSASIKKTVFSSHKQIYFVGNRASCAVTSITLVYLQWLSSVLVFFLTQITLSIISTLAYNLPSIIVMFLPERKGGARTTQLSFLVQSCFLPLVAAWCSWRDAEMLTKISIGQKCHWKDHIL